MGSNSSSSISDGGVGYKEIIGIPKSCGCGIGVILRVSNSAKKPNQSYFQCDLAHERKLVNDKHLFKWFDKALVEEAGVFSRKIDDLHKDNRDLFLLLEGSENKIGEALVEVKNECNKVKMLLFFVIVVGILCFFVVSKTV